MSTLLCLLHWGREELTEKENCHLTTQECLGQYEVTPVSPTSESFASAGFLPFGEAGTLGLHSSPSSQSRLSGVLMARWLEQGLLHLGPCPAPPRLASTT